MNYNNNYLEEPKRLTAAVTATHTDIASTYPEYIQLVFAIASDCEEAGRVSLIDLCRLSAKHDAASAEKLFSNALKNSDNKLHLDTAYYLAEKCGIKVSPPPDNYAMGGDGTHPSTPYTHARTRENRTREDMECHPPVPAGEKYPGDDMVR